MKMSPTLLTCCLLIVASHAARAIEPRRLEIATDNSEMGDAPIVAAIGDRLAADLRAQRLAEVRDGSQTPVAFDVCDTLQNPLLIVAPSGAVGEQRSYVMVDGTPTDAAPTDLSVEEDGEFVKVSDSHFTVWHRKKGGGGFPVRIHFKRSGHVEDGLIFEDWVYSRREGLINRARYDNDSSVRVVHRSPLCVVVEASVRFVGDSPRNVRGTYQYVYTPASPVVRVWCLIEQDQAHPWTEVRIFEPCSKQFNFTSAVVGRPAKRIRLHGPDESTKGFHQGADFAILENPGRGAIGVASALGTVCYDNGNADYYYYVRPNNIALSTRRLLLAGQMYAGAYQEDPAGYARFLEGAAPLARVTGGEAATSVPDSAAELTDDALSLAFTGAESGFACVSAVNRLTGESYLGRSRQSGGLWSLEFRKGPAGETRVLSATNECDRNVQVFKDSAGRRGLLFSWNGLSLKEGAGEVDVEVRVIMAAPGRSEWTLSLTNRSTEYGLASTEFPKLSRIAPPGDCDVLVPGGVWGGRLIRNNTSGYVRTYPSVPMQFWAFLKRRGGLYLGAEDPINRTKVFDVSLGHDFSVLTWAEDMGLPRPRRTLGYPFVLQAFEGDWWSAAAVYRRWAMQQRWCTPGPIATRPNASKLMPKIGIWLRQWQGLRPIETIDPILDKIPEVFGVPMALHWYGTYTHNFNYGFPHYPPLEGVAERFRRANASGLVAMSYINGRLWDSCEKSFEQARPFACETLEGNIYRETYGKSSVLAPMCPYTKFWQDTLINVIRDQIETFDASAFYLDQMGIAGPAICYNPDHGHPVGGGSWWVDGYRAMLARMKELKDSQGRTITLTTEGFTEAYLDLVDGFLIVPARTSQDIPLMPTVYGGYGILFGIHQAEYDPLESYVALHGRDFLWGCQPGWINPFILEKRHADKAKYIEKIAKYRQAAKKFLVYGRLAGRADVSPEPLAIHARCRMGSCSFTLDLPAVQAYVWQALDGSKALFCANLSPEPQRVTARFSLDAEQAWFGAMIDENGGRYPLDGTFGGEVSMPLDLAGFEIRAIEFTKK